jgi:hypothetical protein
MDLEGEDPHAPREKPRIASRPSNQRTAGLSHKRVLGEQTNIAIPSASYWLSHKAA